MHSYPLTLNSLTPHAPSRETMAPLRTMLRDEKNPSVAKFSLGDVALRAGAETAWWCARGISWQAGPIARDLVGALLPSIRRAMGADRPACLVDLERWQAGDNSVDMVGEWRADMVDAWRAAIFATDAAGSPIPMQAITEAWLLALHDRPHRATPVAALAAWLREGERERQAADIIAAFPPIYGL